MIENYLKDMIDQIIEDALELKKNVNSESDVGGLIAYYSIISKLLSQAEGFGIRDKIPSKWHYFNPDSLLDKLGGIPAATRSPQPTPLLPATKAVYQKWVTPNGETLKTLKTTFAPDGKIIHVKPK